MAHDHDDAFPIRPDNGRAARRAAGAVFFGLACLVGCSTEEPLNPDQGGNGPPVNPGFISGRVLAAGAGEITNLIRVEIYASGSSDPVDTVAPDDDGDFVSSGLRAGTYDVVGSITAAGFGTATVPNVPVVAGQTTALERFDIPDTSRVRIFNIAPSPFAAVVPRRPEISGEFTSLGSGIKETTFSLLVNGEQLSGEAELTINDDLFGGSFRYVPRSNLSPGTIEVEVRVANRAGNSTRMPWRFSVLDGIQRHVPDAYDTIQAAYWAANDGDTITVAPGTWVVDNLRIEKEVVMLAAAILEPDGRPDDTVLISGSTGRHLFFPERSSPRTRVVGFLFRDGDVFGQQASGGAILCRTCEVTVESCAFENNRVVRGRGGAIAMLNGAAMRILDCRFAGNQARRGGAIALFDHARPLIESCVFSSNSALAEGAEGGLGGAIYLLASQLDVQRSTFYDNVAGNAGGAIMSDTAADVGGSTIESQLNLYVRNRASSGIINQHFNSVLNSTCDGFMQPQTGALFTGDGRPGVQDRLTVIGFDDDPGFCDPAGGDLRLRSDSPFLSEVCDTPGALPIGCGGLRSAWR